MDVLLGMDYFNLSNACIYPRRGIIKFDDDDVEVNDYEVNRKFIMSNNDSEVEFDRFNGRRKPKIQTSESTVEKVQN